MADERLARAGELTKTPLQRLLRLRTLLYFSVWVAIGAAMLFMLGARDRIELDVAQSRNPVWIRLSDGQVRNSYTIKLRNMENRTRRYELSVRGVDGRIWNQEMNREAATPTLSFEVEPDSVLKQSIYLAAPDSGPTQSPILFTARALDEDGGQAVGQARFERPEE